MGAKYPSYTSARNQFITIKSIKITFVQNLWLPVSITQNPINLTKIKLNKIHNYSTEIK